MPLRKHVIAIIEVLLIYIQAERIYLHMDSFLGSFVLNLQTRMKVGREFNFNFLTRVWVRIQL